MTMTHPYDEPWSSLSPRSRPCAATFALARE